MANTYYVQGAQATTALGLRAQAPGLQDIRGAEAPTPTALGSIETRLHELAHILGDGSNRLDRVADKVFGSGPTTEGTVANRIEAVPSGAIDSINRVIDVLFARADVYVKTTNRLEGVA